MAIHFVASSNSSYSSLITELGNHASLVSSAVVNRKGELPIHLLCEAGKDDEVDNDDSTEYVETIWRMILANPEAIMS